MKRAPVKKTGQAPSFAGGETLLASSPESSSGQAIECHL
jgi:hypothetical protein